MLPQPAQQSVVKFSGVLGVEVAAQLLDVFGQRPRRHKGRQFAGACNTGGDIMGQQNPLAVPCAAAEPPPCASVPMRASKAVAISVCSIAFSSF